MPGKSIKKRNNPVIVLIQTIDLPVIQALRYAMSLSTDIVAFCVTISEDDEAALHARWNTMNTCIPLVTHLSPDGGLVKPVLEFIKSSEHGSTSDMFTVILPQIITSNKWQRLQQYSVSKYLEHKLSRHPQIVFMVFPTHLPDPGLFHGNAGRTDQEDDGT